MGVEDNEAGAWQLIVRPSLVAKWTEGGLGQERRHSTGGSWWVGRCQRRRRQRGLESTQLVEITRQPENVRHPSSGIGGNQISVTYTPTGTIS